MSTGTFFQGGGATEAQTQAMIYDALYGGRVFQGANIYVNVTGAAGNTNFKTGVTVTTYASTLTGKA